MGVVRDWRGTPINTWSVVVYPSRQGSQLWMTEGNVVSIKDGRVGVMKKGGGRVSYPATDRLTVIPVL
jgi:hypothetical protein